MRRLAGLVLALAPGILLAAGPRAAGPSVFDHPADTASLARDLAPATRALAGARTLRGSYVQHKRLAGVPRPLEAEGTFLFVRGLGIAWRTVRPFESELVITGTDILQREGGRVTARLSADRQPAVRIVSETFAAVFALDFEALAQRFELFSRATANGWELGLRPRAGHAGGLREVVVSGARHVTRVRLLDAAGDATDVALRDTAVAADAPSPDELARFSP